MITVIIKKKNGRIVAFNRAGHGTHIENRIEFDTVKIPDQDVDQFYEQTETDETLKKIYYPDDVTTYEDKGEEPPPENSVEKRLERIEENIEVKREGKKEKLGPPPWAKKKKDKGKKKGKK